MARLIQWGVAVLAVAGVAAMGTAMAQDKDSAIKARQDFMKAQSADNKAINDYAKGMGDKAAAEKAAKDLIARADKIDGLFNTPGTSSTDMPGKTNAKAAIWSDRANFAKIPVTLKSYEEKTLAAIQTGTPEQVGEAAAAQGKNGCGACHGTYREPMQH